MSKKSSNTKVNDYENALCEIAFPIFMLQEKAKMNGMQIDGMGAVRYAENPHNFISIAERVLEKHGLTIQSLRNRKEASK